MASQGSFAASRLDVQQAQVLPSRRLRQIPLQLSPSGRVMRGDALCWHQRPLRFPRASLHGCKRGCMRALATSLDCGRMRCLRTCTVHSVCAFSATIKKWTRGFAGWGSRNTTPGTSSLRFVFEICFSEHTHTHTHTHIHKHTHTHTHSPSQSIRCLVPLRLRPVTWVAACMPSLQQICSGMWPCPRAAHCAIATALRLAPLSLQHTHHTQEFK